MNKLPFRARAFGHYWASDIPLGRFDVADGDQDESDFKVQRIDRLPSRGVVARKGHGEICVDGFRFDWANVATFDIKALRQIDYVTCSDWQGTLPDAFFSTVAALAVAGTNMLPMHASAIEIDGRAYLFAGTAGAGKSTLTAELLGRGARLLGDDLTVICPPHGTKGFRVTRGRPAMRLHPQTASLVDAESCELVPDDPRGKLLVRPSARADDREYPLAGIFILDAGLAEVPLTDALRLLALHMFRPRWMTLMPGHGQRQAWLIEIAGKALVRRLPPVVSFDSEARQTRIEAALMAMAN